jgi:hypothetical protein
MTGGRPDLGHQLAMRRSFSQRPLDRYLFRVAAVGRDGKPSAWSATVSYVA